MSTVLLLLGFPVAYLLGSLCGRYIGGRTSPADISSRPLYKPEGGPRAFIPAPPPFTRMTRKQSERLLRQYPADA